jgi:phage protein U
MICVPECTVPYVLLDSVCETKGIFVISRLENPLSDFHQILYTMSFNAHPTCVSLL